MTIDVEQLLSGVTDPLKSAREELENRRASLREELMSIEDQIRRVNRTLRTIDPDSVPVISHKAKANGAAKGRHVTGAYIERIREAIRTFGDSEYRPVDVRTIAGGRSGDSSAAFTVLREAGEIRKVRQHGTSHYFKTIELKSE